MSIEVGTLLLVSFGYLSLLFALAWLTDRGVVPPALASHPLVYTLSLGVIAGAWSLFGMADVASRLGHAYLGYAVGTGSLFLFAPILLLPLLRISRRHQLTSLADVLAFRYRSALVGPAVTLGTLAAALPLVAVELRIVSDVGALLVDHPAGATHRLQIGVLFTLLIAAFAILFGARPISAHERHNGLLVAMAFESLVKLGAILLLGGYAVFGLFGGVAGLRDWIDAQPALAASLADAPQLYALHYFTLIFLAAAIGMPHLFHMALYENPSMRAIGRASWAFPLFLLLMSLPVLPILWAGMRLDLPVPAAYFGSLLGSAKGNVAIALAGFLGAVSATTSTIVVVTLALAGMLMNNLVLPFYRPGARADLYRRIALLRSALTAIVVFAAYSLFRSLPASTPLDGLIFTACIAAAQFFPGVFALLYWPGASRQGFLAGLGAGYLAWLLLVFTPWPDAPLLAFARDLAPVFAFDRWVATALFSLGANTLALVAVSLLWPRDAIEREAAARCSLDAPGAGALGSLASQSPADFVAALVPVLGAAGARNEVEHALAELGLRHHETRPWALHQLRERLQANLSRLLGAAVAMELIERGIPLTQRAAGGGDEAIYDVESRIEGRQEALTGISVELDALRRFYRDTLQNLPVGVCGIDGRDEIVMWNDAAEKLTGIASGAVIGTPLQTVAEPWRGVLGEFVASGEPHRHDQRVAAPGGTLWVSLHQTVGESAHAGTLDARFVLLEDMTQTQLLHQELAHTERLASIGRLAAGVAHEIGNPVTGIACLAQDLVADGGDDGVRDTARQVLVQTQRITSIVQTLVNFAHAGASQAEPVEPVCVRQCADEAIYLLRLDRSARSVNFLNACDPAVTVRANAQRLLQVLVNLLSNARDATAEQGDITVHCRDLGEETEIVVTDSGSGIPQQHLDHVFEPFFTTKPPGAGTGLGLALVYSILRDMQGSITLRSPADAASGRGVSACVRLPAGTAPDILTGNGEGFRSMVSATDTAGRGDPGG